jgi:O-antigen/teichoic acid export membrane protein
MINVARATVTIALNLLLLPTFGIAGAAVAAVLTRPVSTMVILLPHTCGRHVLMLAYGSIFRSNHRVQASANGLVRHRRTMG